MASKIILTAVYDEALKKIEDFIIDQTDGITMLERFWQKHDELLQFIATNPSTPAVHPATGDQSWPFGEGRYRVFFKHLVEKNVIFMTYIIDNRQANLNVYPGNSMPTYDED